MLQCVTRKVDKENVDPKVLKTKNGKTMQSPKCAVCSKKNSRFMKEQ